MNPRSLASGQLVTNRNRKSSCATWHYRLSYKEQFNKASHCGTQKQQSSLVNATPCKIRNLTYKMPIYWVIYAKILLKVTDFYKYIGYDKMVKTEINTCHFNIDG